MIMFDCLLKHEVFVIIDVICMFISIEILLNTGSCRVHSAKILSCISQKDIPTSSSSSFTYIKCYYDLE